MKVEKRGKVYWIVDCEPYAAGKDFYTSMGPYDSRKEAESDIRGMERTTKGARMPRPSSKKGK